MAALLQARSHTPHEIDVALRRVKQREGLFVDWEGSQATQAHQPLRWQSLVQRGQSLSYTPRASPSVLNLTHEQSISTTKLTAHSSLQALQGTTKKTKHLLQSPQQTPPPCTQPCAQSL